MLLVEAKQMLEELLLRNQIAVGRLLVGLGLGALARALKESTQRLLHLDFVLLLSFSLARPALRDALLLEARHTLLFGRLAHSFELGLRRASVVWRRHRTPPAPNLRALVATIATVGVRMRFVGRRIRKIEAMALRVVIRLGVERRTL